MAQGVQCWDAVGNLIFDTTDRMGRICGKIDASATSSPVNVPIALPETGELFWFTFGSATSTNINSIPNVSMTRTVLTYDDCGDCTIYYGVY